MSFSKKLYGVAGALTAFAAATPVWAQDMVKNPTVEQMATMVNKGDVAWMLVSAALVLMMAIPGLALFYGGLVRTKNMLSICMQVFMIVAVCGLAWVGWGYSIAFTSGGISGRRERHNLWRDVQQQRLSA
jgi:Amt family ammonium transporter